MQNKLSFLSRTTLDMEPFLQKTEKAIAEKLLPALTGKTAHTKQHCLLFSLPLKNGGLNILSPDDRTGEYSRSVTLSECLNGKFTVQNPPRTQETEITKQHENWKEILTEGELYAMKLSSEKRASRWLNALSLQKYGFALTKSEFRDA